MTNQPARVEPPHRPRIPREIGEGAGLLAAALLMGLAGGVVWALVRPAYTVRLQDGAAVVDQAASGGNVEFAALGWFAVITAVIGVLLAAIALRQERVGSTRGGLAQLWWLLLAAAAAALTAYACGDIVARMLHPIPGHEEHGAAGESGPFTVAPSVAPGVVLLVAPFTASSLYWVSRVMRVGEGH